MTNLVVFLSLFKKKFFYGLLQFPFLSVFGTVFRVFIYFFLLFVLVRQKGREFLFWTGIVFLTGQVNFVLKWPKGEFVSL
jgi:hypothetical protein